ncbi:hypothetical protein DPEC_G00045140 [Dallia pectoralis]|uniref:Uncharacterized protein n=1 Tax=Dallia pectoralis TaxID=75939 RepID=A0ACC2H9L8_DALPE|nr:hypothetical protein DPEC_G00045140 [Dallia pectoralis]
MSQQSLTVPPTAPRLQPGPPRALELQPHHQPLEPAEAEEELSPPPPPEVGGDWRLPPMLEVEEDRPLSPQPELVPPEPAVHSSPISILLDSHKYCFPVSCLSE